MRHRDPTSAWKTQASNRIRTSQSSSHQLVLILSLLAMALTQPLLPFLRPLGPPRASTIRHLLRFSSSARTSVESSSKESSGTAGTHRCTSRTSPPTDTTTTASPQPSPTSAPPPTSTEQHPSPATQESSPPTSSSPSSPAAPPAHTSTPSRTIKPTSPRNPAEQGQQQHKLSYHVSRTPSAQLPVYKLAKRGGNLHQTRIRKISGNIAALRDELRSWLVGQGVRAEEKDVVVNQVNGHVVVRVSPSRLCEAVVMT